MPNSRIIIVDDEPRICESLKFFLENHGYEVETALNSTQALNIIPTKGFDLFLLDIGLPEISGLDLMARILKESPDAMVVLMTGNATVDSAIAALKTGAYDYFKKPIEIDDLLKTVSTCLKQKALLDENRKMAHKLKISEERYRFIVQNCPDIIYTIDENGHFVFVNEAVKRLLGYEPETLLNQPWTTIIYEKDTEKAKWFLKERRKGARGLSGMEIRFKLKEDVSQYRFFEIRKFNTSLLPRLVDTDADVTSTSTGTYGVARDITYRRQLEFQLFQNDKMDAINTLAGGIAHDFNNLLMGIQGYISLMLLDITSGSPHHDKLKNIEGYIHHAAELTNQILGFARVGKYEPRVMDINNIIEKSADLFGRTKKQLRIHTRYQSDIWPVEIDSAQIEQAILNIFVNAWHAINGTGALYIETQNFTLDRTNLELVTLKPGKYAKILIADNGCRMDDDTMQRIVEPFFTTTTMGHGTGLGLASTYSIIKNHDGLITVKSKPGRGSQFEIYLPVTEKQQGFDLEEAEKEIFKGSETILLVDDEEMILDVTQLMLTDIGYNVLAAKSGMEAIDVYRQHQHTIDIIILDMIMPDMEGSEVVDQIKQINPDTKILLASGYNLNNKVSHILEKGCNGFIQKPFDLQKLSQELHRIQTQV